MLTQNPFVSLVSRTPLTAWVVAAWNWVPITPVGLAALGLIWLAARIYGGNTNDRIVLVGSVVVFVLVAVCVATTFLTALWHRVRPTQPLEGLKLAVNQPQITGFQLSWLTLNPLIKIELAWDNLPESRVAVRRRYAKLSEEVTPGTRGELKQIRRRFVVSDVFGLSRCSFVRTSPARVRIEPDRHRGVPQLVAEQAISGDQIASPDGKPQGDLLELRRYVAGDPLKRVLWKTYARTGQLLVRSEERTRATTKKTLAYFVTGAGDEPTAAVARGMLETGSLGDNFSLGADQCSEIANSVPGALELLIQSKTNPSNSRSRLPEFLTRGAREGATSCVVFVPAQSSAWLTEVAQALAAFPGKAYVVVAAKSVAEPSERRSSWQSWFLAGMKSSPSGDAVLIREQLTNKQTQVILVA